MSLAACIAVFSIGERCIAEEKAQERPKGYILELWINKKDACIALTLRVGSLIFNLIYLCFSKFLPNLVK